MTTASTSTTCDQSTAANYQAWVGEMLTNLTTVGLTQTADICQLTPSNYNASIVVNAQTATSVLTVNSVTSGGNNICFGMLVTGAGIPANTFITYTPGTGTGGTGTYNLSTTPGTIAAESMTIQLSNPTAATQNTVGYSLWRFNDTLQATVPIFFKIDFGSGNAANQPVMFVTVGTGSNGTGSITTPCTRVAASYNIAGNTVTAFPTRWCYNATQGFFGVAWKVGMGGTSATNYYGLGGIYIFRSVDNTGAPTADSVHLLTNSNTITPSASYGYMQVYNAVTSSWMASGSQVGQQPSAYWGVVPFNTNITVVGSIGQVYPVFQYKPSASTPGLGITNALALASGSEIGVGNIVTLTILGSTALTYISVMGSLGTQSATLWGFSWGSQAGGVTPYTTLLMQWM